MGGWSVGLVGGDGVQNAAATAAAGSIHGVGKYRCVNSGRKNSRPLRITAQTEQERIGTLLGIGQNSQRSQRIISERSRGGATRIGSYGLF